MFWTFLSFFIIIESGSKEVGDTIFNLAICEDDKQSLRRIERIIRSSFSNVRVFSFEDLETLDLARDRIEFDIYLMDIELGEDSGFTYARSIRQTNKVCKIAFITAHDEYAIGGYRIRANAYLRKPFEEADLVKIVEEMLDDLADKSRIVTIKENYKNITIVIHEILFIDHANKKTSIHTKNDLFETNESLNSLLERIDCKEFFRVSRSLAINTNQIKCFDFKSEQYRVLFKDGGLGLEESAFKKLIIFLEKIRNG